MKRPMAVAATALGLVVALGTPALTHTYHRVRSGETLSGIAGRYGHSAGTIAAVNDIQNPNLIYVGDRLLVDEWGGGIDASSTPHRSRSSSGDAGSGDSSVCPVQGAVSFTDSFGDPRSGHTHEGVDMMAASGSPVVAVVSGTITFAEYDGSGGNILFLEGDDGNTYYYMHNADNLVTGGRVSAGQQIATVGSTGNADSPHLHFEYHPGGGEAVDPYGLVSSLC